MTLMDCQYLKTPFYRSRANRQLDAPDHSSWPDVGLPRNKGSSGHSELRSSASA